MSLADVQRKLQAAMDRIGAAALAGIEDGAETVAQVALAQTPVRTGKLRASQIVTANGDAAAPQAVIAYTDPKAPRVHEEMRNYKKGSAKFLERAVDQNHAAISGAVNDEVRKAIQ
jgi:hypothetical protein